jgi:hypothetical protein
MVPVGLTGRYGKNYAVLGLRPRAFFSLASAAAALAPRFAGAALTAFFASSSGSTIAAVGAFFCIDWRIFF